MQIMLKIERQFVVFIKCKDSVVGDFVIPALFKNIQYSLFNMCDVIIILITAAFLCKLK